MIGKFLAAWLAAQGAITQLIGTGQAMRFWPQVAPMGLVRLWPRILYVVTEDTKVQTVGNFGGGLRLAKVTLDLQSASQSPYTDLKALAVAIAGTKNSPALHGYRSPPGSNLGGVRIQCARLESEPDAIDLPQDASEVWTAHVLQEWAFAYDEA